ncbi:D-serine_D-alanine_glycine transporter [Candidatus Pantoea carbekii]|uniref:D-serine/D-alanine/glycine transporter n=1 Tax=Candidatus Pantoea carbekii TaxID=1235990 RepID=U3U969_9GAMM|nr:D-serine_D-alanine_glycine transporter [Candidatus Pantoea carbekii]BAO00283.1 D-serine/D-alanine/glycine transporter [Candidatus Pantoea carbekii]
MQNSKIPEHVQEVQSENRKLLKQLDNRHIQLIAIGGAIGTGLFMGSGKIIHLSGSSIILTYTIIGFFLFFVMRALGELLLSDSSFNSFADFSTAYIGPWAGFFIGWTYWLSWVVTCVGDVVVIGGYMQFWFPNLSLWISAFSALGFMLLINTLSVRLFGEMEFWFAIIKIVAILALILVGFVMILAGYTSPDGVKASFSHLIQNGMIFPNGFQGFVSGFQIALFSFVGIELVGIAAAETKNPEVNLPKAINGIPIRVVLFYVSSLVCIISVCSWEYIVPDKSPFVGLFTLAGLPTAAGIINFVVLTSALSSANSGVFSTSRMLFGLARENAAPHAWGKLSTLNVPLRGLFVSGLCMFIGVTLLFITPTVMAVFTLLSTLSSIMLIFIWSMILISWLSYYKQGKCISHNLNYKLPGGKVMAWSGLIFFSFMLVALAFQQDTRNGLLIAPLWFIWLTILWKTKKTTNHLKLKQQ